MTETSSASAHQGSCLCGGVRFEVRGRFESFILCHCGRCRKDTGSAHASNLFAPQATLRWISGEQSVRHYQLPGTLHARSFCSTCGSALPSLQLEGTLLVVPAGSLDSPLPIRPEAHIFCADRASWEEALAETPRFDRLPAHDAADEDG